MCKLGLILWITLTGFWNSPAKAESVADEYESYIADMIPLSFDFAQVNAGLREHEVFINLLSQAQSELGEVSNRLREMSLQAQNFTNATPPACPRNPTGELNQKKILETLFNYHDLQSKLAQTKKHLESYDQIRHSIRNACEGGFEHLRFGQNDFDLLVPKIETFDGVYVSIGNPFQSLIDFVSSLFSLFSNTSEQGRIQNATQHFVEARAKDSDLQTAASNACKNEFSQLNLSFEPLSQFADEAASQIARIEGMPWKNLQIFVLQCIRNDEQMFVKEWIERAVRSVNGRSNDSTSVSIAKIKLRQLVTKASVASNSIPCPDSTQARITSLLGLIQVFDMSQEFVYPLLIQAKTRCEEHQR